MTYAIIGFGPVGQALARAFARQKMDVTVASRKSADENAAAAAAIGATVSAVSIADALLADTILLAIPFSQHEALAGRLDDWSGKLVVDATNAFGVPLGKLGAGWSSGYAAALYRGATFAKAFNHLPAAKLAADPAVNGGRRVIFISVDDPAARAPTDALVGRLGYAPVSLGTFAESGPLVSAREDHWSPLDFQDLVKFDAA